MRNRNCFLHSNGSSVNEILTRALGEHANAVLSRSPWTGKPIAPPRVGTKLYQSIHSPSSVSVTGQSAAKAHCMTASVTHDVRTSL